MGLEILLESSKDSTGACRRFSACFRLEFHSQLQEADLRGEVKIVPELDYYQKDEEVCCMVDHQYVSAFLSGIMEWLMTSGTSVEQSWSKEALEFSALPPSDTLEDFANHSFMKKAVSTSRLIPRIRLVLQIRTSDKQM